MCLLFKKLMETHRFCGDCMRQKILQNLTFAPQLYNMNRRYEHP